MARPRMRYRRLGPVLNPTLVSQRFIEIFKDEIKAAIESGKFKGLQVEYEAPPPAKKKG